PKRGLRSYLGVRGGFAVPPVLGSRSTDRIGGLGPPRPAVGDILPIGTSFAAPRRVALPALGDGPLEVDLGPRDDWFTAAAVETLLSAEYTVLAASDSVGVRLDGPALTRCRAEELPSEGVVRGAVQVPADGRPIVFQADHPVTGGYPVIAVLTPAAADRAAQLRPGARVRFTRAPE
ncbi:MAG TPA: biotin-dependent carboxyltransferase family protein, partial [Actinoplanes sp.]